MIAKTDRHSGKRRYEDGDSDDDDDTHRKRKKRKNYYADDDSMDDDYQADSPSEGMTMSFLPKLPLLSSCSPSIVFNSCLSHSKVCCQ